MTVQIEYKRADSQADIDAFINAWEVVFKRKLSDIIYQWLFSKRNRIYCAYDGDHIAAGYCLLNIDVAINNRELKGVLCNNVFINGFKYQKLGVFNQITEFALRDVSDNYYAFAIGFPNGKAIKSHLRAGWSQGEELPFYEFKKNKSVPDLPNTEVKWFSTNYKAVFSDISECLLKNDKYYSFSLSRSHDFLAWRFQNNPRWNYDIGCIYSNDVLKSYFISKYFSERSRVHLVDYFFGEATDLKAAISAIYRMYEVERGFNIEWIDGWCAQGDQDLFVNADFSRSEKFSHTIYKDLQGGDLSLGHAPHLTLADNDVF